MEDRLLIHAIHNRTNANVFFVSLDNDSFMDIYLLDEELKVAVKTSTDDYTILFTEYKALSKMVNEEAGEGIDRLERAFKNNNYLSYPMFCSLMSAIERKQNKLKEESFPS